jgi:hypothetical protein
MDRDSVSLKLRPPKAKPNLIIRADPADRRYQLWHLHDDALPLRLNASQVRQAIALAQKHLADQDRAEQGKRIVVAGPGIDLGTMKVKV